MRTSRLLAVVIAVTLAASTTNAQADTVFWQDLFEESGGQTWLIAGHNEINSGAGTEVWGSFGTDTNPVSNTIFFTSNSGGFSSTNPDFPAAMLGYVSQSFQDVSVSSVVSNIAIDVSSGIAVRMNPSVDDAAGLLGGYSFSVAQGLDKIKFSLNRHDGAASGIAIISEIHSLAFAEYNWDFYEDGQLGDVSMSLRAVGDQLTGTFSFQNAAGDELVSDALTFSDNTYTDGFSGIVSYAYMGSSGPAPSVIGAAAWGPITSVTAVPEPGTMLALSLLGGGAAYKRYRSRRQQTAQPAA